MYEPRKMNEPNDDYSGIREYSSNQLRADATL